MKRPRQGEKMCSCFVCQFPWDVAKLILDDLPPIALLALRRAIPHLGKTLPRHYFDLRPRIQHLLKLLYPEVGAVDWKRFCLSLQYHRAVLTGSVILQALYGVCWGEYDIDIMHFPITHGKSQLEDFMFKNANVSTITHCFGIKLELHGGLTINKKDCYIGSAGWVYESIGKKLQVCPLCSSNPQIKNIYDAIDVNFDFGFCKVAFDGKKVRIRDWDAVCHMTSKHTLIICDQCGYLDRHKGLRLREEKYKNRGFTISGYQIQYMEDIDCSTRTSHLHKKK